jgi:hypothetical protein
LTKASADRRAHENDSDVRTATAERGGQGALAEVQPDTWSDADASAEAEWHQ